MLAVAGWARYLRGYDVKGHKFQIDDPQSELLTKLANMDNPDALLGQEMFAELRLIPTFTERFGDIVADIDEYGVIPTLRRALGDDVRELVS
jgi:mannitol 2-dehydrogenase